MDKLDRLTTVATSDKSKRSASVNGSPERSWREAVLADSSSMYRAAIENLNRSTDSEMKRAQLTVALRREVA